MRVLAIDVGSSSVKAAILDGSASTHAERIKFNSTHEDDGITPRAQVDADAIEKAIVTAIGKLKNVDTIDMIGATTMSPSWLAMDSKGRALTAVVTHQDRRSVAEANAIETLVGKERHLKSAGNRPFPGGISSTTLAWHLLNDSATKKAALVGHLGTWLSFALTGERSMDLSNAGFTGLLAIDATGKDFGSWDASLVDAVAQVGNIKSPKLRAMMPYVCESNRIIGKVTRAASKRFGIKEGTPVLAGCMDGSAAMLCAGAAVGQFTHISGSTDVLALCTDRPFPNEHLLTRPLGVSSDKRLPLWLSVGTISSVGTSIDWLREVFFSEMIDPVTFYDHVDKLLGSRKHKSNVRFINDLAGSRIAMDVRHGIIDRLTLATKREDIVRALVDDLALESGERMKRLLELGTKTQKEILTTGGVSERIVKEIRRDWPGRFKYRTENEATTRGIYRLAEMAMA